VLVSTWFKFTVHTNASEETRLPLSEAFKHLQKFVSSVMRMAHVYQPVMIQTLIEHEGRATVRQIASALLANDEAQISYYEAITKRYPGTVLSKHNVVRRDGGTYELVGFQDLSSDEKIAIADLCEAKIVQFFEARSDPWSHRRASTGYIPGTVRFAVLKRASQRCELCGVADHIRGLEVDHILPRNKGGAEDISNLQALCFRCNATKRDTDDTDFRGLAQAYAHRQGSCVFCDVGAKRVIAQNELFVAIRDGYPVTEGHTLLIPKRHVESPGGLVQPELNAMSALADQAKLDLRKTDPRIDGFNLGFNDGISAGQTVMHAHVHLIPRRTGDVPEPRGGVRGVIPSKQGY
jgi:diadenosine tetraphosphate (Ap4A) HIT family hydrolase/5-methylcytosine-specific restriction endonuclease McrA